MDILNLHETVSSLLTRIGIQSTFELYPLHGGANNQVFRIDANGSRLCLKVYFQHPDDPRDRLGAEFSFTRFAWNKGIRTIPEPLSADKEGGLALYEFISGRPVCENEVTEFSVEEALCFFNQLNRYKHEPEAGGLLRASEACFSIADHLHLVADRINRLVGIEEEAAIDHDAVQFIQGDLMDFWHSAVRSAKTRVDRFHVPFDQDIRRSDWCLSPSDFGFHNAIRDVGGKLRFIDFEYAGWDDPDRMVCDFFCQQAVPVSMAYYSLFAEKVAEGFGEPEDHRRRMDILLPLYQVKWCCILLNDFLPVGKKRRWFAGHVGNQDEQKAGQLKKARNALKRFQGENIGFSH